MITIDQVTNPAAERRKIVDCELLYDWRDDFWRCMSISIGPCVPSDWLAQALDVIHMSINVNPTR
jgi:hypothetical protein